jgi:hypothetical protein
MTNEQFQQIFFEMEQALRAIANSPAYQKLQTSDHFHTSNDLVLKDAIQSLYEVRGGLQRVKEQS